MPDPHQQAVEVYVALGTNLGDRAAILLSAMQSLKALALPGTLRFSSIYETEPLGPEGQGAYLNAVSCFKTKLSAYALLNTLQNIESAHGRVRGQHWGARTLDLDILYYGQRIIDDPELQIPHAHLHERWFVLKPLSDLAAERLDPVQGKTVGEMLGQLPVTGQVWSEAD